MVGAIVVGATVVRATVVGATVVGATVVGATVVGVGGGVVQNDFGRPRGTKIRVRVSPLALHSSRQAVGTVHPPTVTFFGVMTRWTVLPVRVYSSQQSVAAACAVSVAVLATTNDVAPRATTRAVISHLDARGLPGCRDREAASRSRASALRFRRVCGEMVAGELRGASCMGGASFAEAHLQRPLTTTRQLSGSR